MSPAAPSVFLNALVGTARNRADELTDLVADNPDGQLRDQVNAYVDDLIENTNQMSNQLQQAQFGTFDAHEAMLNYEYSRHIHAARRIHSTYTGSLSAETEETLDELVDILTLFGVAPNISKRRTSSGNSSTSREGSCTRGSLRW